MGGSDDEIAAMDAEIAALEAKRQQALEKQQRQAAREAKENAKVLVATTPTKRDKPRLDNSLPSGPKPVLGVSIQRKLPVKQTLPSLPPSAIAGPSKMTASLAAIQKRPAYSSIPPKPGSQWAGKSRSMPKPATSSVKGKELQSDVESELEVEEEGVRRDGDSLAIVEKLALGPKDFGFDPEGETSWEYVEPNSGIRLGKRVLTHSTIQDHLYGRYYLPPSLLYSVIRLSRDGATYDVPVDGDWVTIAVVAERGDIRVSGGGAAAGGGAELDSTDEEGDIDKKPDLERGDFSLASPSKKKYQKKKAGKDDSEVRRERKPKKFLNLKLAAMPPRSKSGGSGGDAVLQLLLFQAESCVRAEEEDEDGKFKISYKGGSGGAFEKWGNLNVGDVVGIVSPRILRPLKAGGNKPHPLTLPLAINPYSGDSIFHIGKSKDLGCCSAIQRDGNRCRTWVDIRQGQVCEYHVHLAMSRSRGARAEFTASTSSFALTTSKPTARRGAFPAHRKAVGINHTTKQGLLPASGPQAAPRGTENGGGGATYMVGGGNSVRPERTAGAMNNFGQEMLSERLGRGRAEKNRRKMERLETDKVLGRLMAGGQGSSGHKNLKAMKVGIKGGGETKPKRRQRDEEEEDDEGEDTRRPFSAESIKKIGYDPSALARAAGLGKEEKKKKDEAIASLKVHGTGKFEPKKKIRVENVKAPDGYVPGMDKRNSVKFYGGTRGGGSGDSGSEDEDGMIDLD